MTGFQGSGLVLWGLRAFENTCLIGTSLEVGTAGGADSSHCHTEQGRPRIKNSGGLILSLEYIALLVNELNVDG